MRPAYRWLILACTFVAALSLVQGPVLFVQGQRNADKIEGIAQTNRAIGAEINDSLCKLRDNVDQSADDDQRRFDRSKDLIARNPGILDQFGITEEEYAQNQADDLAQIARQRDTVKALGTLDCS